MRAEHIVLTTDLSDESKRPFGPVGALAERTGAKVGLLHSMHPPSSPLQGGGIGSPIETPDYAAETKNAELEVQKLAQSLPSDVDVTAHLVTGNNVADSIVQYAKDENADLIALSTHGRTGIRRLAMGSVAEQVVRKSPIPVLCFPDKGDSTRSGVATEHILLTTDLSSEALRPFGPALELAKSLQCRVTVLHVLPMLQAIPHGAPFAPPIPPPDLEADIARARASVEEQCSSLDHGVDLSIEVLGHEDPARGIVEFAENNAVDLIALSSHGRTGFRRAALGSVAEHVLRRSSVPVLSFHRTEE